MLIRAVWDVKEDQLGRYTYRLFRQILQRCPLARYGRHQQTQYAQSPPYLDTQLIDIVYYGDIPVGALCGRIESKDVPSPTLVILTLA